MHYQQMQMLGEVILSWTALEPSPFVEHTNEFRHAAGYSSTV